MDDNILTHYSNESTFVISVTKSEADPVAVDVTLTEIDVATS